MGVDDGVNLGHKANGVFERHHDALGVGDVLGDEGAAWLALLGAPVVEPLLADLEAADVEGVYLPI